MDTDKITALLHQWKEKNKSLLPLNFDTWDMSIIAKPESDKHPAVMTLGKYQSMKPALFPFYKPISRIIPFPTQNEHGDES